jgi:crotonobetainyl-CoA:carnitine CoA-transferase CaiB-like acyl-CoA transferase
VENLLVVELCKLFPGPLAGQILSSLGFRVVRVLPPQGDLLETLAPDLYAWLNAGKTSEVLNLKEDAGTQRLRSLAATARIILDTSLPGAMERLNVAPEALRKANPELVYVRLAGSRDPLFRNFPSHDLNFLAAAGLVPALDSVWQRLQLADISAAFWMAMAALEGARRGGGSYEIYADEASHVFAYPKIPHLDGNAICYSIYPCSEGSIALAALEPHLWGRFCRAMKRDEWANSAFTTVTDRNPIYRELCSAFSRHDADYWETWAAQAILPLRSVRSFANQKLSSPWRSDE